MIFGPNYTRQQIHRLEPVDRSHDEDDRDERKKRKVLYQGRAWSEKDENISVQPSISQPTQTKKSIVYADRLHLEKAKAFFEKLTTLEEKVAQLCFLETDAVYDADLQREVELFIQAWQLGGVDFRKGDYRRQAYLIERFQEISKTPLLFGNDFIHGLSFYLQGDQLPDDSFSEQKCSDLGKAVMAQNRRIGVHIQFDRKSAGETSMGHQQIKAFCHGIRRAHGIVGREKTDKPSFKSPPAYPFIFSKEFTGQLEIEMQVQETIGFKTLTFYDVSKQGQDFEGDLLKYYLEYSDVFLLSVENFINCIKALCKLVRSGKIREEELDRRVMKALIIKSLYFQVR